MGMPKEPDPRPKGDLAVTLLGLLFVGAMIVIGLLLLAEKSGFLCDSLIC
jgi:hypothetical protein